MTEHENKANRRKYIAGGLVAAAAAIAGGAAYWYYGQSAPSTTPTPTSSPTPTPTPTPTIQKKTLNIMTSDWEEFHVKDLEWAMEKFQERNPNIRLDNTYVSFNDSPTWLVGALMSGTAPDMTSSLTTQEIGQFLHLGVTRDLTDNLKKIPEFYDDVWPFLWDATRFNDGIHFIPHGLFCEPVLFLRTSFLEEAGIEGYPRGGEVLEGYWDFDHFVDVAQELKALPGVDSGFAARLASGLSFDKVIPQFMWANDADVIVQNEDGQWVSGVTASEFRETFQNWADLVHKYKVTSPDVVGYGFTQAINGFFEGKIAMLAIGGWFRGSLQANYPDFDDYCIMAFPKTGYTPGDTRQAYYLSCSAVLNSCPEDIVDWAVKWQQFRYGPEVLSQVTLQDWAPPSTWSYYALARKSGMETLKQWPDEYATNQRWLNIVSNWGRPWTMHPKWLGIVETVLTPITHKVTLGTMTVDDAIDLMDAQIMQALKN